MEKIKYTFLLPAYKATYFEEALLSIKNQTYKDFKVLVSDDCSPEELEPIYNRTVGDDPRFTFRRNQENMGSKSLVSHWNLLVDLCDTDYLMMAGDDDVYDVRFLEEMDKLVVKYPEVDILRARVIQIDGANQKLREDAIYKEYASHLDFMAQIYYNNACLCVANYVYKTQALQRKGGFIDFPLAWYSDFATAIQQSENGLVNSKDALFYFRMSGINLSTQKVRMSSREAFMKISATLQYSKWLKEALSSVECVDKESSCTQQLVLLWGGQNISGMISNYLPYLSLKDFVIVLREIKKQRLGAKHFLFLYLMK